MCLESRWMRVTGAISLLLQCASGTTTTPSALSVTPSTKWYGDDGVWSAISIRVGSPQQWLDVLVSTVSSETWVPGMGSCNVNDTVCIANKGSLFNPQTSKTWQEEGFFDLGIDYQLGNTAYAEYGLDNLTFGTTGVTIPTAIIGAFNGSEPTSATQYFNGLFGVGVIPGNFTNITPLSAISALVEELGVIPSHSYGYTAGASYQLKGVLNSLTLGGYDANRFVPHNVSFTLNPSKEPQAFVNSISVVSAGTSNNWTTAVSLLETADDVSAIIDSSTPFLWLPVTACDRFAEALGLTYNSTLNLYTFDANPSQHDVLVNSQLSFNFILSDFSSATEMVNIILPYAAFDLELIYPAIPNTNYGDPDSSKYYFPLRQASNAAQYTIGRAFLQEAYLITDYERNIFSVHQAVQVLDSVNNISIVSISRPSTSTFAGPPAADTATTESFPQGAIIGIAIGATALLALLITIALFIYRKIYPKAVDLDDKVIDRPQTTFFGRFRNRPSEPPVHAYETNGSTVFPTEVGADATHERFELPAPLGPVELESDSGTSMYGSTQDGSGTQDSQMLSEYERARRKLEHQLALSITQAHAQMDIRPAEKREQDISTVAHYRPLDVANYNSPLVSPMAAEFGGSTLGIGDHPSPVSPGFPITSEVPLSPPPTYRRINPDNVVYAGRLPHNVRLPRTLPQIMGPDGRPVQQDFEELAHNQEGGTNDSLGSHYTINESVQQQLDLYGSGDTPVVSPVHSGSTGSGHGSDPISPLTQTGSGNTFGAHQTPEAISTDLLQSEVRSGGNLSRRTLGAGDLVHVPQVAENRFSWEEERLSGNEGDGIGTL